MATGKQALVDIRGDTQDFKDAHLFSFGDGVIDRTMKIDKIVEDEVEVNLESIKKVETKFDAAISYDDPDVDRDWL